MILKWSGNQFIQFIDEFTTGRPLETHSVGAFLVRLVQSSKALKKMGGEFAKIEEIRGAHTNKEKEAFEKRRIVANVLGLSTVVAVSYAQGWLVFIYLVRLVYSPIFSLRTGCGFLSRRQV